MNPLPPLLYELHRLRVLTPLELHARVGDRLGEAQTG